MKHTVILDLKSDEVLGVAKLKETLYVLCRSLSSISIHVANDFDPERSRKQAPLTEVSSPIDMVASELNNCLYISDRGNKCIWKLTPDLRLTRWMSRIYQPMTMSISTQGHVIMVRNTNPPVLDVYGSRGELFDQYRIPLVLQSPKHVVETSNGDFVVLHKFRDFEGGRRMSWGVSRMNTDGKVTCRFIPSDVSQMLYRPRRLSIDEDDRVFVVDPGTARLTILGSNLNWIQEFSTNGCDKIRIIPLALCYDKRMKCLLVGDKFSGVFMLAV